MGSAVLLIEDNPDTARLLTRALEGTSDAFEVTAVFSARAGLEHLAQQPVDCVLLDYRLPDADGLACLRRIRETHRDVPVIVVTGAGSEEVAVEAMKLGATDYLVKHGKYLLALPVKVREALGRRELERAAARYRSALRSTRREVRRLRHELRERYRIDGIIGRSAAIEQALVQAEAAAQSQVTVLLEGETGTGKDLLAHAIHYHGPRARGPFVPLNCAALPEPLLESELFGHVRGAFTGADRSRRGVFEEATGGTLFLDEVGEMTPAIQAKLLRVLEDGCVRPLGGGSRRVDVRIVAATNRDLRQAVEQGRFRRDLYHRLNVFPIRLPPLRERRDDIRPLAVHLLRHLAEQEGKTVAGFHHDALRLLEAYPWPGNVRELENELHRLVVSAEPGARIEPQMLSPWIVDAAAAAAEEAGRPLKEVVRQVEVATISDRLRRHGNHRAATARSLGVSREWLWAKMRALGIRVPDAAAEEPEDEAETRARAEGDDD
jgi:DNA-binding NtrC family response regulator